MKWLLMIVSILLLTGLIKVAVGAQNVDDSKTVVLPSAPVDVTAPLVESMPSTASPTTTTETTPTPSAIEELQPSNKWFTLNTNKISVRVAKTKTIKINYVVFGNSFNYSKKDISSLIKKGHFKFNSNKPKIAKVTKKGVVKGVKKGKARIKVTLRGANKPRYCTVRVWGKDKK